MDQLNFELVPVIMAGGAGTRFWPLSTEEKPKQFLSLFGSRSLVQKSFDRIAGIVKPERILVLTNARFLHYVREQLPQVPPENVIGEPVRRDTAAAITIAALLARKKFGNPVLVILTADHVIEPEVTFQNAVLSAARAAREAGTIYTFGIAPDYPARAYGYLELGEKLHCQDGVSHFRLLSFREKPEEHIARQYLAKGNYCWNSGMFIGSTDTILSQIQKFLPGHIARLDKALSSYGTAGWEEKFLRALEPLPSISIDFGVMEKAAGLRCAVATFFWKDVGGWLAMEEYLEKDAHQNSHRGYLHSLDANHNLVFCEDVGETVALVGVDNVVVVRAGKCTLIVDRHRTEDIKKIVKSL